MNSKRTRGQNYSRAQRTGSSNITFKRGVAVKKAALNKRSQRKGQSNAAKTNHKNIPVKDASKKKRTDLRPRLSVALRNPNQVPLPASRKQEQAPNSSESMHVAENKRADNRERSKVKKERTVKTQMKLDASKEGVQTRSQSNASKRNAEPIPGGSKKATKSSKVAKKNRFPTQLPNERNEGVQTRSRAKPKNKKQDKRK